MAFFNRGKQELEEALSKLDASEKRIEALESEIRTIGQSTAILRMSPDGLIDSASDRFLEMLSHTQDALAGQHHRILCEECYAQSESYMKFWQALVIGQTQQGCFASIDGKGNLVWLDACYTPIKGDNGMIQRIIATISNLSEHRSQQGDNVR